MVNLNKNWLGWNGTISKKMIISLRPNVLKDNLDKEHWDTPNMDGEV